MNRTKVLLGAMVVVWAAMFLVPVAAQAISAPSSGSFAYDVYDIAINQILKGPIGFVCGGAAIVLGAVNAIGGRVMSAVPCVLGGAAILKADAITTSLGLLF